MANLMQQEMDFGIKAEWHNHGTAHGKGSAAGVGAVFKREAGRYSLICKSNEAIYISRRFYEWSKTQHKFLLH